MTFKRLNNIEELTLKSSEEALRHRIVIAVPLAMPMVDGDMMFEARSLMEATRCYDLDLIADICSARWGFKAQDLRTDRAQAPLTAATQATVRSDIL